MLLNRDQILKADTLPTEDVDVPDLGGTVRVRGLTGREAVEYQESQIIVRGGKREVNSANMMAKLVVRCVIDDDGKLLFGPEDVDLLGELPARAVTQVFEVAARLSGLADEAVEDAGKGSATTPSGGSSSVSPATSTPQTRTRSSKASVAGS